MKTPEEYGLRREITLTDPEQNEIYRRIISSLTEPINPLRNIRPIPVTDLASVMEQISHPLTIDDSMTEPAQQALIQSQKTRNRGAVLYERQIGLDLFDYLLSHASKKRDFVFLDLGCGDGFCSEDVAVFSEVMNLPVGVHGADLNCPSVMYHAVVPHSIDMLTLGETAQYDLIAASMVLPYAPNQLLALENMYNAAKVGGLVAATIFPDSVTIDLKPAFEPSSPFGKKIKKSGGQLKIVSIPNNPDGGSAIHLIRGPEKVERHSMQFSFTKPENYFPVDVKYFSYL